MTIDGRDGFDVQAIDVDLDGIPVIDFAGLGIGFMQEDGGLGQPRPQHLCLSYQSTRTIV